MEAVGATSLCLAHGCSSVVNQLVSVSQTLPENLEMGVEDVHDAYCPRTALFLNLKLAFLKILLISKVCVLIKKEKSFLLFWDDRSHLAHWQVGVV